MCRFFTVSGGVCLLLIVCLGVSGCGSAWIRPGNLSVLQATSLATRGLVGDTGPVRDPSIWMAGGTYYVFSTDPANAPSGQVLPIRCSQDKVSWTSCGQVFTAVPGWVTRAVPGLNGLWAPDISYFGGLYHLYYAGSTLGSQVSAIGEATNTTLDPNAEGYAWVDRGEVIASGPHSDFNAIDPNIVVDGDGRVWMTYGSYWSGIKQREIDPKTGLLLASDATIYSLAARPGVSDDAIEGASLVQHGGFYYLFLSVDHCCEDSLALDDYKQIVGRATSVHGPFLDAQGAALTNGGGSVLLESNGGWIAPGGGTVYLNAESGDSLIVFHALSSRRNGEGELWMKTVSWQNGWPVLSE
jgi:arabinan endo-1,5-alpha-L-arabinosidase